MSDASTENDARPSITSDNATSLRTAASESSGKPRSCAICAQRKVRCDKTFPCSRCRSAGIECVPPSVNRRPRWARHLGSPPSRNATSLYRGSAAATVRADRTLERLQLLERLVRDLSGELEQARGTSSATASQSGSHPSGASSTHLVDASSPPEQTGRVILDESDRVRYVSSAFWSRVDQELDTLRAASLDCEDDSTGGSSGGAYVPPKPLTSTGEADRAPFDRNAFLLKHNLSSATHDLSTFLPMPSQIPFMLEIFSERVHFIIGLPHMPSLKQLLQPLRSGRNESSSPEEEALLFSVFYAAICSLDEDEVMTSFNVSRTELTLKYRIGLEHALAKADFLNHPTDVVVQALVIFLTLVRRNDSPKYIWMMTGLVVRMAHYVGMHHAGAGSKHITPFQVEMHRRIWWNLSVLDIQATDDQGTELAISHGSYSTSIPSNINDVDIWPAMEHTPSEHQGPTNVTMLRLCSTITRRTQELIAANASATIDDRYNWLSDLTKELDREYFGRIDASRDPAYVAAAGFMRIALGRLTILAFVPMIYSAPSQSLSPEMRDRLMVAAIAVLEHNHALNCDAGCQPWRWVYQTQPHWHAIVYLLIEICRRPWSSTIERAWVALQSPWLVPARAGVDKNFSVLIPLRRLMARARKHRESELLRLRNDTEAADNAEKEDREQIPTPSSSTTFPTYFEDETFHQRWLQLVQTSAATTSSTLNGASSTSPNNHDMADFSAYTGPMAHANNPRETMPFLQTNSTPFTTTLNVGASGLITEPLMGASMNATDYGNLYNFLGAGTQMGPFDVMNDDELLNYDWNSWLESAKGTL